MSTALRDIGSASVPAAFSATALAVLLERMPAAGLCVLTIDGSIAHWHASAERLLGHVEGHIAGQPLESLCPDERRFEAALPRALFDASAEAHSTLEAALLTRAGERRVCMLDIRPQVDAHDDVVGFVVLMRAAHGTTLQMREPGDNACPAIAHRMNLARAEREAAWLGIDLAVRVTHFNDPAAERLDLDAGGLLGSPLADLLQPETGEDWRVILHRAVRGHQPYIVTAIAVETAQKTGVQVLTLRGGTGQLEGFTLNMRVPRGNLRAAGGGENDNYWWLAAAHDLREPLRKMRHYAGYLQATEAPRLSDTGRRHIDSLQASAERMHAMIGGMLRLARVDSEPGSVYEIDLDAIVEDARSDLAMLIDEHDARVEVEALGRMRGDVDQLRALFQNLIDNSIRYRRPGIVPEIRIAPAAGLATDAPTAVTIDYRDNARGIDAGDAVFSAVPRTRSGDHGSGIGLPLCRRICRRHHGDLHIQDTDATGTCFRITLDHFDSGNRKRV